MPSWIRKGWKVASGQPVKNEIDFKELNALLMANKTMQIKWVTHNQIEMYHTFIKQIQIFPLQNYVKAHCGILGNERADELARQGGQMYKKCY